jgi:hypothetical protein
MPFLTVPFGPDGPLTDLYVALSTPRIDALKKANLAYPPPVQITGLIDTGASCSAIDPTAVSSLGLTPSGKAQVLSSTTGTTPQTCDVFDVCLAFVNPEVKVIGVTISVFEASFANRRFNMLIGRDVLDSCLFIYDAKHKTFSLAF